MRKRTLVLGIGNTLLGDDGAGIYAVRQLQAQFDATTDVEFLDGGTLSFTLAGSIGEADNLIVIDAAELDSSPGTLRIFLDRDMDQFLGANRKSSVHEVSLLDLMSVALLSGNLPRRRALIGIQPQHLDWADGPSEAVAQAIPMACREAANLIGAWQ